MENYSFLVDSVDLFFTKFDGSGMSHIEDAVRLNPEMFKGVPVKRSNTTYEAIVTIELAMPIKDTPIKLCKKARDFVYGDVGPVGEYDGCEFRVVR